MTVKLLRTSGLLTTRTVPMRVGCDTACTLTASATLSPASAPKKGRPITVSVAGAPISLAAGQSRIVRLTFSRTAKRRLTKALGARRGLALAIRVDATGPVGDPTTLQQDLSVRR